VANHLAQLLIKSNNTPRTVISTHHTLFFNVMGNELKKNLNISRYISTAVAEEEIDLGAVNAELVSLEQKIDAATEKHNTFLKELGLPPLPSGSGTVRQ
jgi:hypothetical protein